jgi:hypothetical protein
LKKNRKRAFETFCREVRTETLFAEVLAATRRQGSEQRMKEPQYRPHGARWLHDHRWLDGTDGEATAPAHAPTKYYVPDWENGPTPIKQNQETNTEE